ncbi:MAG TPA: OmpA family protein [Planctomycetota bacterium]|nr:OmpA family protein [Planctomycetota bacterium]
MKESNRRLKESNDRLISENNRLEEELASLQRKQGEHAPIEPALTAAVTANDMPANPKPAKVTGKAAILDGLDEEVEVFETGQGIKLRIPDRVFFPLGQASLSTRGQKILDKVAAVINANPGHLVRVDGHTDDTPIRKVRNIYPTNWELSSARACTVVRYLVDRGNVNARRIFPAGFSYYRPVSSSKSPSSKSQNRRVEITILNENV